MSKPVVAIVGRPNVGKSSLFNTLYGERISIVHDTPGVTRDRIYADAEWRGRQFIMIDTGGIEPGDNEDYILKQMRVQAEIAIETADVILFITDLHAGLTAADEEIAVMLRKAGRPVVVAVNKVDTVGDPPAEFYEFYQLGLENVCSISAAHRLGLGEMLDMIFEQFPDTEDEEEEEGSIRVALIGRPNAGKSSLANKMIGQDRSIVSDIAGTTRDTIDSDIENDYGKFTIVDTAGMRKKGKIEDVIERYSMVRALSAIERADVCVIMIDATEGVTEQDTRIAGLAHDSGKASVFVINKWDLIEKDDKTMQEFRTKLENDFSFMSYVPFVFISAKTGQRINKLYELIKYTFEQNSMRISTGMLNDVLAYATTRVQPPSDKGRRLKIYYMTQPSTKPPTFVTFVNRADLFHFSYRRYIENQIRSTFGLEGTPVRFIVRERGGNDK